MEFEDVKEKADAEAQRLAVAFGLETFDLDDEDHNRRGYWTDYWGEWQGQLIMWTIELVSASFTHISTDEDSRTSSLSEEWPRGEKKQWDVYPLRHPHLDALMARGLYRLGFEDEGVLSQLPPLSAHEKLEVRLSMPREFWPQKWRDEEGE